MRVVCLKAIEWEVTISFSISCLHEKRAKSLPISEQFVGSPYVASDSDLIAKVIVTLLVVII